MNPIEIKKKSKGRKKIEIKRIEKEESRQVCFSKRRQGLFKKANELCTLCGAEVAIIVSSIAGKPYSFGHPSVDHVLRRFLNIPSPSKTSSTTVNSLEPMNQELAYLHKNLEAEVKRHGALEEARKGPWPVPKPCSWDNDLSLMGIEELRAYGEILLDLQAIVAQTSQQNIYYAPEAVMRPIDDPPMNNIGEAYYLLLQQ